MTDRIYVTYTPTTAPGTYHTTIHYERAGPAGDVVEHLTIEAEPENMENLSASDKAIGVVEEASRGDDGPSRFGRIDAYVREQTTTQYPNAPYEIIAEGDDLSANLARMRLFAHAVNGAGFAYRGDRQNSNSFAAAALQAGELPPATGVAHDPAGPPGELLEFFAPGLNEPLRAPIGPRREAGEVARRSFDNRFGKWVSSPAGAAPSPAGADPEAFNNRFGHWTSTPAPGFGDTRSPVLRALEKYRTSAIPDGLIPTSGPGAHHATPAVQPDTSGTGGLLGKFMEDGFLTPAVAASSSLSALSGPASPNFANREFALGDRSKNPPSGPRLDAYPQLRRVSSAFPGVTPRDSEQPATPLEYAPLRGIFSGEPISPILQAIWGLRDRSSASPAGALSNSLAGLTWRNPAALSWEDHPRGS